MGLGARLKKIRNLRGMTMKYLGICLGYPERSADTRVSEFESEKRNPNEDIIKKMADTLNVATEYLTTPDIEDRNQLMHTLFLMEEEFGITIEKESFGIYLRADPHHPSFNLTFSNLEAWAEQKAAYKAEKITQEEYDQWKYNFPASHAQNIKDKLKSQK